MCYLCMKLYFKSVFLATMEQTVMCHLNFFHSVLIYQFYKRLSVSDMHLLIFCTGDDLLYLFFKKKLLEANVYALINIDLPAAI